ncbi:unnamed protein product [Trifolium pratense]|uniref:Uncharacterized protein n=1 Tax=Trifolium pratense TaxID=57577 RepID=A0ACB0IBK1_TRIPR|nr:unnamed protein product [Trifolium pratense]
MIPLLEQVLQRGNIADVKMSESLATKFMEFCKDRTDFCPIIVIVKNGHLTQAIDNYPVQVSNAWNGTRLLINEDIY